MSFNNKHDALFGFWFQRSLRPFLASFQDDSVDSIHSQESVLIPCIVLHFFDLCWTLLGKLASVLSTSMERSFWLTNYFVLTYSLTIGVLSFGDFSAWSPLRPYVRRSPATCEWWFVSPRRCPISSHYNIGYETFLKRRETSKQKQKIWRFRWLKR